LTRRFHMVSIHRFKPGVEMVVRYLLVLSLSLATTASAQARVGPPRGAVIVVGGGAVGPEIYARFIELAGGPDALIVDVPTAGGDTTYPPDWRGTRGLKAAGARNVVVLHTVDRKVADTDSFAARLARAGGVWFEGGRQWHLVDSYGGTKTEKAFHGVLARGGVVGGSSAGASILGSYLVRGAPAGNNIVMAPGYETGFGFLRGVGIDQHVVARERLRDLADSLMPRRPDLLGISEDEGTAWVVQGDVAEIIGRNKAFVYNGKDPTDLGVPYLALRPGDKYNLSARRVTRRAIDDTPLTDAFIDSVFRDFSHPGDSAAVVVAQNGRVFVSRAYGIPRHPKYQPPTTATFALGGLSGVLNGHIASLLAREGNLRPDEPLADIGGETLRHFLERGPPDAKAGVLFGALLARIGGAPDYPRLVAQRIFTPIGSHWSTVDATGQFAASVDELYRWELGLENGRTFLSDSTATLPTSPSTTATADAISAIGWRTDTYMGMTRMSAFGTAQGTRNAFVRIPARRASIIILTNRDAADVRGMADRILDRLVASPGGKTNR
jgi:cyanophycinase